MSGAVLDITGLSCGYGEATVVRNVSLEVRPGEIFALLGKNGMGKSTLLKSVMGFLPLHAGRVGLSGHDITGMPPHKVARLDIAYTPQEQALFQDLTVEDNLRLGMRDDAAFDAGVKRIGQFFPVLPTRLKQRAGTLSGGEQKMLLVSRALMSKPKLMLVDEISEGLQPSVIERLAGVLRAERDESGVSILLIEQNVKFALSVANRYAVLKLGEIVDRGDIGGADVERRITDQLSV
ncbi:MAG: ABC transporter ATP-binding protein [Betaproteobacteria bacterium]